MIILMLMMMVRVMTKVMAGVEKFGGPNRGADLLSSPSSSTTRIMDASKQTHRHLIILLC